MINYYEVIIKGKYRKNVILQIIKNNINIYDVKYFNNYISFKVSYVDYLLIKKIKTSSNIEIINVHGVTKIKLLFNKYRIFIVLFVISLLIIFIFSKMVFFIRINSNNNEIKQIIEKELFNNNITLYSFKKSYKKLNIISKSIKNKYNNYFEWIEISTNGVYYNINLIERKKNDKLNTIGSNNIIASKNGMIIDMYVEKGEILKNKGDYVNKGDIIVSGVIKKDDNIKSIVSAKAKVYAETWYKVKISYPYKYHEKTNSTSGQSKIIISIFNKDFTLLTLNKKKLNNASSKYILCNDLFKLKISNKYKEHFIIKEYNKDELVDIINDLATKKIQKALSSDEKILMQKTLKILSYDDKLYMEVFFKVYENIAGNSKIDINY